MPPEEVKWQYGYCRFCDAKVRTRTREDGNVVIQHLPPACSDFMNAATAVAVEEPKKT